MAFTDQVSHAAMAGQYQLEQTFLLPVSAMSVARRASTSARSRPMSVPAITDLVMLAGSRLSRDELRRRQRSSVSSKR